MREQIPEIMVRSLTVANFPSPDVPADDTVPAMADVPFPRLQARFILLALSASGTIAAIVAVLDGKWRVAVSIYGITLLGLLLLLIWGARSLRRPADANPAVPASDGRRLPAGNRRN